MAHLLVLADTHLRDDQLGRLPPEVWELAAEADAVVHAGDVTDVALLDALGGLAPVHAVAGNNDHGPTARLPGRLTVVVGGAVVAVVHDAGPRKGRPARLHRWFPDAALVVFGHSHEPEITVGVDGQVLLNPGSPTQRRRQPAHTVGLAQVADGVVVGVQHRVVHPAALPRR